jgi:hypothetical protein
MKPLHYAFLFAGLLLALVGCEPKRDLYPYLNNPVIEIGPGLSQAFDYSQLAYAKVKNTPDSIAVLLVGKARETPITVKYIIDDANATAVRPTDYTVAGTLGEVVIPAGKNLAYIQLRINPVSSLKLFRIILKSATDVPISTRYDNLLYGIASSPV